MRRLSVSPNSATEANTVQTRGRSRFASIDADAAPPGGHPRMEDLVNMDDPWEVFVEVCRVARLIHCGIDLRALRSAFEKAVRLFRGEYPGYRACNTYYHDLNHTANCLLAMVRLLHGACLRGASISPDTLKLGLISAVFHDSGYIQQIHEISGTGAQFTLIHIDRSIAFLEKFSAQHSDPPLDTAAAAQFLKCTGLDVSIAAIAFKDDEHALVGKALGAADLLGQMADRTYVERLPLLYTEFREGEVPGFSDEADLMRKTPAFWEYAKKRLAEDLGAVDRFAADHFRFTRGIERNLYRDAIEANIRYVSLLMQNHPADYRDHLRRDPSRGSGPEPACAVT